MPLIFAVDSDKRQSAQLASLLRAHVEADLVQSSSAAEGIAILQGRVPDLILTSSLLSPRDETALANHLRDLGAAAAHVQTLNIPVLAAAQAKKKKRTSSMLGALRRGKASDPNGDGCDPVVFAQQVRLYFDRAVEQRQHALTAESAEAYADRHNPVPPVATNSGVEEWTAPETVDHAVFLGVVDRPHVEPSIEVANAVPIVVQPLVVAPTIVVEVALVTGRAESEQAYARSVPESPAEPEVSIWKEPDAPAAAYGVDTPEEHTAVVAFEVAAEADPVVWPVDVAPPTTAANELAAVATIGPSEETISLDPEPTWSAPAPIPAEVTAELEVAEATNASPVVVAAEPDVVAAEPDVVVQVASAAGDSIASSAIVSEELMVLPTEPADVPAVAADTPGDLILETPEAIALDSLMAQAPATVADAGQPAETPVPVVDMVSFDDLDALADQLAATSYSQPYSSGGRPGEPKDEFAAFEQLFAPAAPASAEPAPALEPTPALEPVLALEPILAVEPTPEVEPTLAIESAPEVEAVVMAAEAIEAPASRHEAPNAVHDEGSEPTGEPMEPVAVPAAAPPVIDVATEPAADSAPAAKVEPVAPLMAAYRLAEVEPPGPAADETTINVAADQAAVERMAEPARPEPAPKLAQAPVPSWSWMDDEVVASLSDVLSRVGASASDDTPEVPADASLEEPQPAASDPVEPVTAPEPVPAIEVAQEPAASVFEDVYDPAAAENWNLVARGWQAPAPAAPVETPPDVYPSAHVAADSYDPVSAAAWLTAVTTGSTTAPARPSPADEWAVTTTKGGRLAPADPFEPKPVEPEPAPGALVLDPDALASIGLAAHRASLEAFESLSDARLRPQEAAASERARPDRRESRTSRASKARKAQHKQPRPAQDEWGMFDPNQCGPDALFDEDEWNDEDEDEKRPTPRARAY